MRRMVAAASVLAFALLAGTAHGQFLGDLSAATGVQSTLSGMGVSNGSAAKAAATQAANQSWCPIKILSDYANRVAAETAKPPASAWANGGSGGQTAGWATGSPARGAAGNGWVVASASTGAGNTAWAAAATSRGAAGTGWTVANAGAGAGAKGWSALGTSARSPSPGGRVWASGATAKVGTAWTKSGQPSPARR